LAETRLSAVKPRVRVAVVGGDTLLGKEVRERLEESKPSPRIELIAANTEDGTVLATDDEDAIAMTPLTAQSLTGAKVAFLAGSPASSRRALKANPEDGPVLIDLTSALEEQPEARLRAPSAERTLPKAEGFFLENDDGQPASSPKTTRVQVIAHPAAIAVATLLQTLSEHARIRRSIVNVFEPASERGKKALDELQQQTVAVLTFQKLKTAVFDAQLAFNLLARYGEESLEPLEEVEARVGRHLASLLAAHHLSAGVSTSANGAVPMPSLRLIQAPVFHGHSFSVWVEFAEELDQGRGTPDRKERDRKEQDREKEDRGNQARKHDVRTLTVETVADWLSEAGIDVRPDDPPSNANIAGQSGLSVGSISPDPNQPRAYWIWMVADNLRLVAENAVAVARELL
jgi:aspartate-semialdehyde dehydrogenase